MDPHKLIVKMGSTAIQSSVALQLQDGTIRELTRCTRVVLDTGNSDQPDDAVPTAIVSMFAQDFEGVIDIPPDQGAAILHMELRRDLSFLSEDDAATLRHWRDWEAAIDKAVARGPIEAQENRFRSDALKVIDAILNKLAMRSEMPF
jgi:hypothetical protein